MSTLACPIMVFLLPPWQVGTQQELVLLARTGAQAQVKHDVNTKVEDPESPKGDAKGPAIKRQHFVVMRHGERIDEVTANSPQHAQHISTIACSPTCDLSTGLQDVPSNLLFSSSFLVSSACCAWQTC